MPSPPRRKGPLPIRPALHERSDSKTNERHSPTLRIVGEPQAAVYGNSPYPTKPSQIFPPRAQDIGQGFLGGAQQSVSHSSNPPDETKDYLEDLTVEAETENVSRAEKGHDASSAQRSSTTASYHSPQIVTPLQSSSSFPEQTQQEEDAGTVQVLDEAGDPPTDPKISLDLDSVPLSTFHENTHTSFMTPKDSESSLSSYNSTGTVIVKKARRTIGKPASYSAFPRPNSSRSNLSTSTLQKIPVSDVSPVSPVVPATVPSTEHRTSSMSAPSQTSRSAPANLQYPVIKPPAASASWAETPYFSNQRDQRILERPQGRWNPHLSTVQSLPSETTGSGSDGHASQTMWLPDSSRVSKSSSAMVGRASSETAAMPSRPGTRGNTEVPPLPALNSVHHRNITGSTIRVVNEQEDQILELPPPISASRDSGHFGTAQNRASQKNIITRRGSRSSFFRDSIPAWAKAYYTRPTSSFSIPGSRDSKPSVSMDDSSANGLQLPKSRNQGFTGNFGIGEPSWMQRPTTASHFSPHLWHDRASLGRRRTIFQAPSLDEKVEYHAFNRRNAQIFLFAFGFIIPPAWFIASFLPLPERPHLASSKGKDRQIPRVSELENQLAPIDDARYENARWWRNINRSLSIFGIMILAAIVALAVVAST